MSGFTRVNGNDFYFLKIKEKNPTLELNDCHISINLY